MPSSCKEHLSMSPNERTGLWTAINHDNPGLKPFVEQSGCLSS